ncbi:aspartate/methionine/tyrosine aminotransferase [Lentimicrobium saccharophilum]|uniref:Aspartate/methionine/tyrosine aminotransferase n=1 Tax=Lentimicrobium saccharophilum TaxID=1678841 RepID=A0A0S7BNR0_9BACT|nr:methionine aminotransferase [Lentimicrobium saccharophilum]GAP42213.1 aspartate/methionine/tyrosine aminotransferase [Lentimicrobium saccharophilum]
MENYTGSLISKLPFTGTSIFAVMSALAKEHNAINLSQGFPDFPVSEELIKLVNSYMKKGLNQYAPMPGILPLREGISEMFETRYGVKYHPETEVTITAGATQGLFSIISAFIRPGDEVVVLEPAYDSYAPAVMLQGGMVKYARLQAPDYSINWDTFPALISGRTRMIIINSPHNPTGTIIKAKDLKKLDTLLKNRDILVLSDEVYEHLIFDGHTHESICRYPGLASRSLLVGSFGKTFHATGWKCGFVLAPPQLTAEFRKVHQFVVFAVNTPVQHAIAEYLRNPEHYKHLGRFYQEKRDLFLNLIKGSRFKAVPASGTYFQLLNYSKISDEKETAFAERLTREFKIASVPVSPFYHNQEDNKVLRFCFAKTTETLEKAAEILCRI